MELVEKNIGLKRTKIGASGKEQAYIISSNNARNLAFVLLAASVCCIIVGLSMKNDLSVQTGYADAAANRAMYNMQAVFNTKMLSRMDEQAQEAKLMKVMSVLQQHLGRDRQEGDMFQAFEGRFDKIIEEHKTDVKGALEALDGNPILVNKMTGLLMTNAKAFQGSVLKITRRYGDSIQEESMAAEQRLMDASEALVNELQAEVEEQAALKEQDQSEAEKSMKWKMLQQQFKAHYREKGKAKTIVRRTKDEKDVHTMLENFEEKVNSLNPPDLTQKELKTAEELQMKLANAKPEEIPAIQDQMKKMADEAGMFFISSDGLKIGEIGNEFNEMVDEAKFRSAQDTIKEQLNQWIDKKMSDAEMMLVIQKRVSRGEVNPAWLLSGQTKQEATNMLKTSQDDHDSKNLAKVTFYQKRKGSLKGRPTPPPDTKN